ncbi:MULTISPECIES: TenA family transcriptional regulator [Pseudomonas]|uniref:TenA family transcriptional regulator n=1 Tax=Pseudomonas putida TaxID=303 RepID=A0A6S5TLL9_PSEPU|nr:MULTISPECIES: iron-containing redox enzyme family protein [Pseudomonas]MBH3359937.1 TenA family transcriptional regulator [Pseudomonas guariconensis]MDD2090872.1 iron-containing redox enzyme family protein [Pseudomonas guariconensis]MDM9595277.1 iron-containing redox enzyme family protein [Pseudomonas guariconensis]MDM9608107.1 iron-containing redox enzyme family protein [Pseudomonas guariconensis]MDM9613064.1 iron-containing redox enzyme family protein [Pseudomonas guariconensis]
MIDTFVRIGPLMDAASYPDWAQQLIEECRESKRRVVEHEFYQRLRDGQLKQATIRQYLIGGWPVVEQFSLYMAHNLTKTRFARHPGEDMARRWLMRNIRVELNHADYWLHWCQAHGITLADLQAQEVPPELNGLNDWCWRVCATESLALSMAATNYAIEGATGEWAALVCSTDTYALSFPEDIRKRAMKWLKMHAQYDDAHPWEALEIICTLAGEHPTPGLRAELRRTICKSYDCMFLFLERCMQLEHRQPGRLRPALAIG